jgi:hypothetical protein
VDATDPQILHPRRGKSGTEIHPRWMPNFALSTQKTAGGALPHRYSNPQFGEEFRRVSASDFAMARLVHSCAE